ncbi:MAG TPA: 4-alpha-glucanotransferase [Candidatus Binatia bacterium]
MPVGDPLQKLARLYNLQTVYRDGFGQLRAAPPDAVLAVLKSLHASVSSQDDVADALRRRREELWQRPIEPVLTVWEGSPFHLKIRIPQRFAEAPIKYQITLETGALVEGECSDGQRVCTREVEGLEYVARTFTLPPLPLGYHQLELQLGDSSVASFVISAPAQAYGSASRKTWGVFCPVYALNSDRSWGAGDYTDLAAFAEFVGDYKGSAVATLPMLASFLDEPFNPSPYAPVSRLFWNEFYLDVTSIPELKACAAAQSLVNSSEFQRDLICMKNESLIDYRKCMELKRQIIEKLLDYLRSKDSRRRRSFKNYAANHPRTRDYAAFRAEVERYRTVWFQWPDVARDGTLNPGDYDEKNYLYHLYVQWQCGQQNSSLRDSANKRGVRLYLDFPLGVNRDGYDVWRERDLFALDASGGAPPDSLFLKGQNWGFPPFNPDAMRRQHYRYYIDCLRHHMQLAGMLRIDHIMGLHRAFWVPAGFSAAEGLYVHQRGDEYYAILNLESHRHQVQIVGENLGTVPVYVNETMARRNIFGMHVGIFGVNASAERALDNVTANTIASLNTHDTTPFMGFWTGADIEDRLQLGLLTQPQAEQEQQFRAAQRCALVEFLQNRGLLPEGNVTPDAVLKAWLAFLAQNDEAFLLINLEDLWLEPAPQNTPGTWQERPNWQRKARLSLEAIRQSDSIAQLLQTIGDIRRRVG